MTNDELNRQKVFVYEAITSGAGWAAANGTLPAASLLAEGLAMVRAVTEDFVVIGGMQVYGLRDARLPDFHLPRQEVLVHSAAEEMTKFQQLAGESDWTLVIAPELDGMLLERHDWLAGMSVKLLSPGEKFVRIASSKRATAEVLRRHGISATREGEEPYQFPLVLKRDDGAGSTGMKLIHSAEELKTLTPALSQGERGKSRLEPYYPGLPASVAVLCGPGGNVPLQPCEQILQAEAFEYLGGRTPLPPRLAARATKLAHQAVSAMPPAIGYVGVDLVLGTKDDGSQDVVIEINPRLTTSYVGLRRACRQNLAQAMLDVACERGVDLRFGEERVEFRADGSIT